MTPRQMKHKASLFFFFSVYWYSATRYNNPWRFPMPHRALINHIPWFVSRNTTSDRRGPSPLGENMEIHAVLVFKKSQKCLCRACLSNTLNGLIESIIRFGNQAGGSRDATNLLFFNDSPFWRIRFEKTNPWDCASASSPPIWSPFHFLIEIREG